MMQYKSQSNSSDASDAKVDQLVKVDDPTQSKTSTNGIKTAIAAVMRGAAMIGGGIAAVGVTTNALTAVAKGGASVGQITGAIGAAAVGAEAFNIATSTVGAIVRVGDSSNDSKHSSLPLPTLSLSRTNYCKRQNDTKALELKEQNHAEYLHLQCQEAEHSAASLARLNKQVIAEIPDLRRELKDETLHPQSRELLLDAIAHSESLEKVSDVPVDEMELSSEEKELLRLTAVPLPAPRT